MTEYQYRLYPRDKRLVQVRKVTQRPSGSGRVRLPESAWQVYMLCSSAKSALHILKLLTAQQQREAVTA